MKAQVSLEYATTYSWAIVIMVVIVGSLLYYGSTESERGDTFNCNIGPQFVCTDSYLSKDGELGIKFRNNIQDELVIKEIDLPDYPASFCWPSPNTVAPGEYGSILCNMNEGVFQGDKESIQTSIVFELTNVKDNLGANPEFEVNGYLTTQIELEVYDKEQICDVDGDGAWSDTPICGGNDCDDGDPDLIQPECRTNNDCGVDMECNGAGSCNAFCVGIPLPPPPPPKDGGGDKGPPDVGN